MYAVARRTAFLIAVLVALGLSVGLAFAQDLAKKLPSDVQTSNVRTMNASGNVTVVQNDRKAVAGQAVFDNVKRTLTLTDNPHLKQGADELNADTMIFYLDDGRSEFLGEISVFINPGKLKKDTDNTKDHMFVLDADQPIRVTAKKSTGKSIPKGMELTFDGNVRVRQGQVTLTCDKLVVVFDDEKARNVVRGESGD